MTVSRDLEAYARNLLNTITQMHMTRWRCAAGTTCRSGVSCTPELKSLPSPPSLVPLAKPFPIAWQRFQTCPTTAMLTSRVTCTAFNSDWQAGSDQDRSSADQQTRYQHSSKSPQDWQKKPWQKQGSKQGQWLRRPPTSNTAHEGDDEDEEESEPEPEDPEKIRSYTLTS